MAGTLGTDALDAALTATTWRDRLLGTNVQATLSLHVTWFATGNNLEFGADTLRRVMPIRLCSPHERPEERGDFRHPDLLGWIKAERPRLVIAALTMLRAYCVAGRPKVGIKPWGSYEAWSDLVRGAVVWSGLPDPALAREELTSSADSERNAIHDLLAGWRALFGDAGGTVAECLSTLEKSKADLCDDHHRMRDALAEICPTKPGTLPTAAALGKRLRRHRGRVVGGLALDGRKSKTGIRWVARQVTKGDDGDVGDDVSPLTPKNQILSTGETSSPTSPSSPVRLRTRSEVKRSRGES